MILAVSTLVVLLLNIHQAFSVDYDPYIVCTGSPEARYLNWWYRTPWPPGYNVSMYPTWIDFCSSAFGVRVGHPGTFNLTSNNAGCHCTSDSYGKMDCPVEDAAPALAKDPNFGYFTAACTQQCRCTTQAKSDAYRVHGALSNAKYELTSSILKDDVIPYDSLTSHPIVPPPNVSNGEIANNPDRFCGFEACDSNADCSAFGVCGSCSIKTYIPGVDNLVYLWAVCEIAHNTTTGDAPIWEPGGNSTLGLEGFDSSTGAIGGLPRRRVKRATDYGCACNATYTRPECCGIPDGQLAANNLPSLGIVQPFADGQRFTPATAEA